MSNKQHRVARVGEPRVGEGHTVDVHVISADAETTTFRIEGPELPVPERKYSCDRAQVIQDAIGSRILFAQQKPIGDDLLSMLVVKFSAEGAQQLLDSVTDEFTKIAAANAKLEELSEFKATPAQCVVLNGNHILAGFTGTTACLDIYYTSPFSMHHLAATRKMAFDPIVRVMLNTGLMLAVVDALRKFTPPKPTKLKVET